MCFQGGKAFEGFSLRKTVIECVITTDEGGGRFMGFFNIYVYLERSIVFAVVLGRSSLLDMKYYGFPLPF